MSEPTKYPAAKRLRLLANEPAQVPPDVAIPENSPMESGSDNGPLPTNLLERTDTKSLLLQLLQTDASAVDLTNALKDRQIRDLLKVRGLKVHAVDDIGYNSLPLELRAQIRGYVIADVRQDECVSSRRKCSPRLSAYACIDTEWRAAVEAITFQTLRMGRTTKKCKRDLDHFERSLVGNRPQYLERIGLPCTLSCNRKQRFVYGSHEAGISTKSICRLFESMKQWQEVDLPAGNLHLELMRLGFLNPRYRLYTDGVLNELAELPSVPRVNSLSLPGDAQMPFEVLMVLLLSLPRLRRLAIGYADINFEPLKCAEISAEHLDYAAQIHLFFTDLSHAAPSIKALEVSSNMERINFPIAEYRNAFMSYSQKLEELSLSHTNLAAILECLFPFRAENFDPQASPVLSWPNLTHFNIAMCYGDELGYIEMMRESILRLGRAVRNMPLIQSLRVAGSFACTDSRGSERTDSILFTLEVSWDDALNGLRAKLSISPDWLNCDGSDMFPSAVTRAVASEEMKDLWRESLLKGAKAVLEVHVATGDAPDEDGSDEDYLDEGDTDDYVTGGYDTDDYDTDRGDYV